MLVVSSVFGSCLDHVLTNAFFNVVLVFSSVADYRWRIQLHQRTTQERWVDQGKWPLHVARCWWLVARCSLFVVQCSVFSVCCSVFSVRCSVFVVQCSVFSVRRCCSLLFVARCPLPSTDTTLLFFCVCHFSGVPIAFFPPVFSYLMSTPAERPAHAAHSLLRGPRGVHMLSSVVRRRVSCYYCCSLPLPFVRQMHTD
jgi:hypothetical protein